MPRLYAHARDFVFNATITSQQPRDAKSATRKIKKDEKSTWRQWMAFEWHQRL